jgi:hypothetical protein
MNLCDCVVVKVLDIREGYGKYWVDVMYDSWGGISKHSLMFDTYTEALDVDVGYKFIA